MRARGLSVYGGLTGMRYEDHASYEGAETVATEMNHANAWNVNGSSGNVNNANKTNRNYVLAVAACADSEFVKGMWDAYHDCCRGKSTSKQYIEYVPFAQEDVPKLAQEVYSMAWRPSTSRCFLIPKPKLRECFAAHFRDRIVHHWICMRLLPLFEQRCHELGDVSHACRKGYGTKTAIQQVVDGMERVSHNYTRKAWVYHGDIVGFFSSLDQNILWRILKTLIESQYQGKDKEQLLCAVETTVRHRPEEDCEVVIPVSHWADLPKNRSMFYCEKDKGEPIGNITTQHYAGYYLSFLDEFVLNLFKGKNFSYTRSVDDFVIVCDDKAFLKSAIKSIDKYLLSELSLRTHTESVYLQEVSHGVKFLGQWIKPHRRYVINRSTGGFLQQFYALCRQCERGISLADLHAYETSINARLGILAQGRTYNIRHKMLDIANKAFYKFYTIRNMRSIRLKRQYRLIN